jgi:hypothetical protein
MTASQLEFRLGFRLRFRLGFRLEVRLAYLGLDRLVPPGRPAL